MNFNKILNKLNYTKVFTKNDLYSNNFLLNLINLTLPHIITEQKYNTHLLVDKLNGKVYYSHLFYNLHLNSQMIQVSDYLLMKRENMLKKEFHNYDVKSFTIGTGFYSKLIIPHNIKTLHRENYHKLIGVNEYLDTIGCNISFENNKQYKNSFKNNFHYRNWIISNKHN
jgi:hypothetical protein